MVKDYAKNKYKTSKYRINLMIMRSRWFLLGLLSGVALCTIIIYSPWQSIQNIHVLMHKIPHTSKQKASVPKYPHFEFYNVLPEMSVPATSHTPQQNNQPTRTYMLQVASFTQRQDAEQLKMQLLQQHYQVKLQQFNKLDKIWYRVLIGPYTNLNTAKQAQNKLKTKHVNSLLLTFNN